MTTSSQAPEALSSAPPQELVERGLALLGQDRGTIVVVRSGEANLRWANSTLTTNGLSSTTTVHVAALPEVSGGRAAGSASGVVASQSDLAALVARARAAAIGSGPAQDESDEVAVETSDTELGRRHRKAPPPTSWSRSVRSWVRSCRTGTCGTSAMPSTASRPPTSGTTSGIRRRNVQPAARFELCGKSPQGDRSAWAGRSGRYFAGVDLLTTPHDVRASLAAQANHIDVPAGRQRIILTSSAAADLLVYLLWSAGARDAVEGRSAFSRPGGGTRIGERLANLPFWLGSDPGAPGLECADHLLDTTSSGMSSAFDAGLPLTPTRWIDAGELTSLITTRHSARLANLPNTPAIDNLLAGVAGRDGTLEDLASPGR